MTNNAFAIPATGIAIRQQSNKQIKQNATRVTIAYATEIGVEKI